MRIRRGVSYHNLQSYVASTSDFDDLLAWANESDVTIYSLGAAEFWTNFLVIHNEELFVLRWL